VYDGANAYGDYVSGNWTRYLAGDQLDELFARYDSTNGVEWYLTDRQRSVRDIVNGGGVVTYSVYYDSFGNIPSGAETNPANGDRFKFTGREWDGEISQYNYRTRYYDPRVGRFDIEDLAGFGGGDVNLYRYVGNSPTNSTDPSGQEKAIYRGDAYDNTGKILLIIYQADNDQGPLYGVLTRDGKQQFFGKCIQDPAANPPVIIRKNQQDPKSEILGGVWYNVGFGNPKDRDNFNEDWAKIQKNEKLTGQQLVKELEALIKKYEKAGKLKSSVPNCPAYQKFTFDRDPRKDGSTWPKDNKGKELERFPNGYLNPTLVKP
jgi:RHS repeat-associated protein